MTRTIKTSANSITPSYEQTFNDFITECFTNEGPKCFNSALSEVKESGAVRYLSPDVKNHLSQTIWKIKNIWKSSTRKCSSAPSPMSMHGTLKQLETVCFLTQKTPNDILEVGNSLENTSRIVSFFTKAELESLCRLIFQATNSTALLKACKKEFGSAVKGETFAFNIPVLYSPMTMNLLVLTLSNRSTSERQKTQASFQVLNFFYIDFFKSEDDPVAIAIPNQTTIANWFDENNWTSLWEPAFNFAKKAFRNLVQEAYAPISPNLPQLLNKAFTDSVNANHMKAKNTKTISLKYEEYNNDLDVFRNSYLNNFFDSTYEEVEEEQNDKGSLRKGKTAIDTLLENADKRSAKH